MRDRYKQPIPRVIGKRRSACEWSHEHGWIHNPTHREINWGVEEEPDRERRRT